MRHCIVGLVVVSLSLAVQMKSAAGEKDKAPPVYPAALFPFEERGPAVKDYGLKVMDLLFAKLAVKPALYLVDRADLKKTLEELELNISGAVDPGQANQVGQLTGAKLLICGSVIQVDKKTYLVAKIIGTETSRVVGVSVTGKTSDELDPLVEQLAEEVTDAIAKNADKLVAHVPPPADRIAALVKKLGKGSRPVVMIEIAERHIGAPAIDPAAQTEVAKFCKETGFAVIDPEEGLRGQADVLIRGEAFSELASRTGGLIAVRARVEIKAIDRKTAKVIAIDRQTCLRIGLSEQIAAKDALQEAAAILAERMLPKLLKANK